MTRRRVYLRPGHTDMRKSINTLGLLAQDVMKLNLFEKSYFLFCNRRKDIMKILYWDKNGFCLWQKKLDKDRFPWPGCGEEVKEIPAQRLFWLLRGINFFKEHNTSEEEKYIKI